LTWINIVQVARTPKIKPGHWTGIIGDHGETYCIDPNTWTMLHRPA